AVCSGAGKVEVAAWTGSRTRRLVPIRVSAGKFVVTREGKRETVEAGVGGLKIELTDTVAYVATEGFNAGLAEVAAWRRLRPEDDIAFGRNRRPEPGSAHGAIRLSGEAVAKQEVEYLSPNPLAVEGLPPVEY